jgi:enoyl-CoA hydratase/carnithine racemase
MIDTGKDVIINDAAGARWLRLARPDKKNALTVAMYAALADAIESAQMRDDVAAIVFAAEGTAFTAGNDLGDFMRNPPAGFDSPVFRFLRAIAHSSLPLIAAVPGAAVGIGTTMLLHCDFVYATPNAKFVLPFVDLGLVPEAASSLLLPRAIGNLKAAAMLYLGEPLSAQDALALGLISAIVGPHELEATAAATAAALAAKPRAALLATRKLVRGGVEEVEKRMLAEGEVFRQQLASPEAQKAFAAFFQTRAARPS